MLELGEVRVYRAHLFAPGYEMIIEKLPNRKVLSLKILNKDKHTIELESVGTLSCLLHKCTGFALNLC